MPYGGTTPEQDKKIERCVTGLVGKGRDKSSSIAICKSSIMKGGEGKVEDIEWAEALMKHEGLTMDEVVLSTQTRKDLPTTAFCGPDRSYPAHDLAHARNALARVSQFGSPSLQARVRACVHNKFPELAKKEGVKDMTSFKESLTFSFKEGTIDEDKRTVRVCALAPCISKNSRFYSPKVVESALGTLTGKKSFADHDDRDTKNLIGRIVAEDMKNGKLYADIRVSKASGIAKQTWEKIQDGTITDVSIAADGKTKRVKLGEQVVDEVTELQIHSVDFVTEGGVSDAKVMQVFENVKDIPTISEVKEEMTKEETTVLEQQKMDACMKGMMAKGKSEDMAKKTCTAMMGGKEEDYSSIVDMFEQPLKDKITDLETKMIAKEVGEHKESEISKLKVKEEIKILLREKVSGKTKEEVSKSVTDVLEDIKKTLKTVTGEAKIEGIAETKKDEKKETKDFNSEYIRQEAKIPENLKGKTIEILWNEGEVKAKEYLKSNKVEL